MPRTRVSTTVDTDLLDQVRKQMPGAKDHALLDTALVALLAANRPPRVDASYAAYDDIRPMSLTTGGDARPGDSRRGDGDTCRARGAVVVRDHRRRAAPGGRLSRDVAIPGCAVSCRAAPRRCAVGQ